MADYITVIKDAELRPQLVRWHDDAASFFVDLLSPAALLAEILPPEKALEPLSAAAARAVFDGDEGLLDVHIQSEIQLAPAERSVIRDILAGVWAPARVRLTYEGSEGGPHILVGRDNDVVDYGKIVRSALNAFALEDQEEFYRNVTSALHERGFGELPPGRAWRPPEGETELILCALSFALRAARAGAARAGAARAGGER